MTAPQFGFSPTAAGPRRVAQFIIELVGPRSTPGVLAREALQHPWFEALGRPDVFCMDPRDRFWRPMTLEDPAASYDSVALAWRYLEPRGKLSGRSAERLYHASERLANRLERVAMPLLPPEHVGAHVQFLEEVRTRFDVILALTVRPASGWLDPAEVSRILEGHRFREVSPGWSLFLPEWPEALLEAAAEYEVYTGAPQILALDFGFRVARNPDPIWSLGKLEEVVAHVNAHKPCLTIDDNGQLVDSARWEWIRAQVAALTRELKQNGLPPGSPEALMVFFD